MSIHSSMHVAEKRGITTALWSYLLIGMFNYLGRAPLGHGRDDLGLGRSVGAACRTLPRQQNDGAWIFAAAAGSTDRWNVQRGFGCDRELIIVWAERVVGEERRGLTKWEGKALPACLPV